MKITFLRIFFILILINNIGKGFEILAQSDKLLDKILPLTDCYDGEKIKESFIINDEKNDKAYEMMSVIIQQGTRGRSYTETLITLIGYLSQELPRSLQITDLENELHQTVNEETVNSSNFQAKKNKMACITARFLHGAYLKNPTLLLSLPKHYNFYSKADAQEGIADNLGKQLSNFEGEKKDINLFYNTLTVALVLIVLIVLFIFWLRSKQRFLAEEIDKKIATAVNENTSSKEINQKIANLESQQAKNQTKSHGNLDINEEAYLQKTKKIAKTLLTKESTQIYAELDERLESLEGKITRKFDVLQKETTKEQEKQNDLLQKAITEKKLKQMLFELKQDLISYIDERHSTQTYQGIPNGIPDAIVETKYLKTIFSGVPTLDGLFLHRRFSNIPTQDAFYQLSILADNPTEAEYTLVNNSDWLRNAFARKKTHILYACKAIGPRDFHKILKIQTGIAVKEEDNWRIKVKADIYYE